MVAKVYGMTWWGRKWLDCLANIDYENRIPRGKQYAEAGKVLKIDIDQASHSIIAKVEGRSFSSYTVRLKFLPVTIQQKESFAEALAQDIKIVSKLADRQLDPALFDLALQHKIKLFPESWQDLNMYCSCPDWAVPCKHIAAVIYKISELIDANPFLVFELLGIDLIKEFDRIKLINKDEANRIETPKFADVFQTALVSEKSLIKTANQMRFDLDKADLFNPDTQAIYHLTFEEVDILQTAQKELEGTVSKELESLENEENQPLSPVVRKELTELIAQARTASEKTRQQETQDSTTNNNTKSQNSSINKTRKTSSVRKTTKKATEKPQKSTQDKAKENSQVKDLAKPKTKKKTASKDASQSLNTSNDLANTAEQANKQTEVDHKDQPLASKTTRTRATTALKRGRKAKTVMECDDILEEYSAELDEFGNLVKEDPADQIFDVTKIPTRYQGNIEKLKELTYHPIPEIGQSLFNLFADNAPGFPNNNLRKRFTFYIQQASCLANTAIHDKSDRDLPVFNFDQGLILPEFELNESHHNFPFFTDHQDFDCAKDSKRNKIARTGYYAKYPPFYLDARGYLSLNIPWDLTTYDKKGAYLYTLEILPSLFKRFQAKVMPFYKAFNALVLKEKNINHATIEIQILGYLWFIASQLVQKQAIMPQLSINYNNNLQCRWIPTTLSKEIRNFVTQVGLAIQGYEHLLFNRVDTKFYLDPLFLGQLILSPFIHSYVAWAFIQNATEIDKTVADYRFIFQGMQLPLESDQIELVATRLRLESWFAPLSIDNSTYIPVLKMYDLASPAMYENTVFQLLENTINQKALEVKEHYHANFYNYQKSMPDAISLSDLDDGFAETTDTEPSYSEAFDNNRGIGLELGFINLPFDLEDALHEEGVAEDSGFVPLRDIINHPLCEKVRYECLRTTSRLSAISPAIDEILHNPYYVSIISLDNLYEVYQNITKSLTLLGVRLILPRSLKRTFLKPMTTLNMSMLDVEGLTSFLDLQDALTFDWQLAIGEHQLTKAEFNILLANASRIVRFRNQFVYADPELLTQIKQNIKKLESFSENKTNALMAILTQDYEGNPVVLSQKLRESLKQILADTEVALPKNLKATLRPYQESGYKWLMRNIKVHIGSILADDMGLGKTLQVIAALLKLKQENEINAEKQALIVVPTSLITNWRREIKNFAPDLRVHEFYGFNNNLDVKNTDVVITSYGTARSRIKALKERKYRLVVVDEAQAIKNLKTAITKSVRELNADHFIAMSGTPVENRLFDYFSILDFVNRGLFGSINRFNDEFVRPIEVDRDAEAVQRFKLLTAPFLLRRLKTDKNIISDLPEKMTSDQYCTLTKTQTALYEAVVSHNLSSIQSAETEAARRGRLFKLITDVKAICNSPAQYDGGSEDNFKASDSGKVERLFELLEEIEENNGKALVFTQSVIMGKFLQKLIDERFNYRPEFLYGGIDRKQRVVMVDAFQNDPKERILIISLLAGGTGLNLTAANYVIHFDLWWNPAVENQATDRAYRIGQNKNVQVYRFICANTFEEKINEMLKEKRELADLTVSEGESWIGSLSDRQLTDLFSLQK